MHPDFNSIISRLEQEQLWDFPGGVFPAENKMPSCAQPIARIPLAGKLFVPVKQHIGVEGNVIVNAGDTVLKGQPLTATGHPFGVPVHAPTSGVIAAIHPHVSAHPSGLPELTVELHPDRQEQWCELTPMPDYQARPKTDVLGAICDAGISGMGGAGFPTHIKVSHDKNVEFLIINGVECEPYITSDDRLMQDHAWQIRQGIDVLHYLLDPGKVIIAIEDNKPDAIAAMALACQDNPDYMVVRVPTKYPAGGEKQLIQVLTGREVPVKGLPTDVGVVMQNVGTCYAIADAIFSGKPLIERVVTLAGKALDRNENVWALLGTPMSHLLSQAEYHKKRQRNPRLIMGGPMMGFNLISDQVPVIKTTNCLLVPDDKELPLKQDERPCIRCSACADACPASLLPQQLYWHSKANELDKVQDYNLFDCIECGACAFVCPSDIPLVHYYRKSKAEIRNQEMEKHKSDKARERFESRKERLLKEQQQREEKHRKAAEARKQAMQKDGGSSKDKIAEALARAKAKKQQNAATASAEVPAAEAANGATDKKSQVAAAIARAKAKKQAAQVSAENNQEQQQPIAETRAESAQDDKKARVAAAVARAKAKKQAAQLAENAEATPQANTEQAVTENSTDDKKARIAAAVAKAKAKKQAQQSQTSADERTEPVQSDANADTAAADKKARIAAAVAKAKAKKAAQQASVSNNDKNPSS